MKESNWERYGAAAGVLFVALFVVSLFMVPTPPHIDDSNAKVVKYFVDNRTAILASCLVGVFAVVFFLWFVGHLRHVLDRAEGGAEAISPIVFAAGAATAGAGAIASLPTLVLAFSAKTPAVVGDPGLVRMLWSSVQLMNGVVGIVAGVFLLAAALAVVRKEMVAPWLGWVGIGVTAVSWVGSGAMFFQTTYSTTWTVVSMVGFLGFLAWVLTASIIMLQRPEVARAASRAPVFAS